MADEPKKTSNSVQEPSDIDAGLWSNKKAREAVFGFGEERLISALKRCREEFQRKYKSMTKETSDVEKMIANAHEDIRTALEVKYGSPMRLDYYASCINELKDTVRRQKVIIEEMAKL